MGGSNPAVTGIPPKTAKIQTGAVLKKGEREKRTSQMY
jgi:hypothetical protein